MKGGVFCYTVHGKKTAGPLSFVLKYMSGTSPPRRKKERDKTQGTSLLDGRKDRITTH